MVPVDSVYAETTGTALQLRVAEHILPTGSHGLVFGTPDIFRFVHILRGIFKTIKH